jgi:three-Cys-motif partner protein
VNAADGLPARSGGPWTRQKLGYLKKYAEAFAGAMRGKWPRLVYIDLLAGPGLNIDEAGEQFDGSPLIALGVQPRFDYLYLGDAEQANVDALERRVVPADRARIELERSDCHARVIEVMTALPPGALGLAFVDPEGFEVRFEMFEQLARGRVDVLFLFPTGGITRNLRLFAERQASPLDHLLSGWRRLPTARALAGRRLTLDDERALRRSILGEFRQRMMALGFRHQDKGDPPAVNAKGAFMYHLMFFSKHEAGLTLWRGIKKIDPDQQRTLSFSD